MMCYATEAGKLPLRHCFNCPLHYLNFGTLCIYVLHIICYTLIQLTVKLTVGCQKQHTVYTKIPLCNCQRVLWMPVRNLWS